MNAKSPVGVTRRLAELAGTGHNQFFAACGLGLLAATCGVGLIACAAWLISAAALQPHLVTLGVAIVGVRAFAIGKATLRYVERLVSHDAAFRMLARIRARFIAALEPLSPGALPMFRRGDLLDRMAADVDALQDLPLRVLQPAVVAIGVGVMSVGLVAALLPGAAVALLSTLVIAGVAIPVVTAWANRRAEAMQSAARAELTASVVTLLRSRRELVAYGAAAEQLEAAGAQDAELTRIARRAAIATGFGAGIWTLCAGAAVWAALALGTRAVRDGTLTGVALAVIVLIPLAAFEALQALPAATLAHTRAHRSGTRVLELLATPAPVPEPSAHCPLPPSPWPVTLRDAGAHWPGGDPGNEGAISGIDLDLWPGRSVAVVGASGAGKSTLAAMLVRFIDLDTGTFRLGTTDVSRLWGDDVRRVVGLCGQDAHLFDSTLRENLRLARPECDDATLLRALDQARLTDWVTRLPSGLDTHLGEGGITASEGERRRIALARALLAEFPVIVFDEPTANLDPPTAEALARDLLAATSDRATVLITHRLTALDAVDEIIVIDNGRVSERGTHAELVCAGGIYTGLRRAAFRPGPTDGSDDG
ncbi:thiol reductant ABC exporter subunit CydC [Mycolicibacterium sp.]|uniref:thiol reductant ABC exporter subunit CydC n=1 Tax=Mycolicibacterium sp. TaxID=2320850 RepID=UPI0037CAF10A